MSDVTMVTTPDDGSCGIGNYTGDLLRAMPEALDANEVYVELGSLDPFEFLRAAFEAGLSDAPTVHVQHEYGIFGPKSLMSWLFFPILFVLATLRDKRIVVTFHSAWNSDTVGAPLRPLKRAYVALNNRMVAAIADEAVFLSENCKEKFLESAPLESVTVLPHGVPTETKPMDEADAKAEFGYDPDETVIVEPGYVRPEKGCDLFVDLARRLEDYSFLLAGGSQGADEYFEEIRREIPENVQMTGVLSDRRFHAAFIAADLVVLPYREVTQSGIFNWCAAYERPVVGSDEPYFERLSDNWDAVEVVDFNDIDRAASIVRTIVESDERSRELKERVGKYRSDRSFEGVVEKQLDIYQRADTSSGG
ncbi:glycosyltransferase [Natronoarchaeum mannanilyticum]|uniref:Glycosyltransferase n=1 Tax=Natronoarchaeum mannanilyticum TaxID=926360 RepID=A0AAV3T8V0_9EURY